MNKKKLFRVPVVMTTYLYIDVLASDEDEAYQIADTMNGCDFIEEDCSWTIDTEGIGELNTNKCTECEGKGYLADVHQYSADGILESKVGIERCDTCQVFESDKEAKEHLKREGWTA